MFWGKFFKEMKENWIGNCFEIIFITHTHTHTHTHFKSKLIVWQPKDLRLGGSIHSTKGGMRYQRSEYKPSLGQISIYVKTSRGLLSVLLLTLCTVNGAWYMVSPWQLYICNGKDRAGPHIQWEMNPSTGVITQVTRLVFFLIILIIIIIRSRAPAN